MDKAQALHEFWSSFGIKAFDELSAYDKNMSLPDRYITYEVQTANFESPVGLTASLWYHSTSWAEISQKADQIAAYIGYGGKLLPVDGGYIWIKLGSPFARRMSVEDDDSIRRIYINIAVEYLTAV